MIARRTPAAAFLVFAVALAGCELVAGIKERPLGDGGGDAPGAGGTTGTAGSGAGGGRGGAGGSAAGTAGAAGGAGVGGASAGGTTAGAGAGGASGAAGRGGAGGTGAGGTTGAAGTGGATGGRGGTSGSAGAAGTGGAAGTSGTGGAAGTSGTAGTGGGSGGAGGRGGTTGGSGGAGGRGGAAGSSGGSAAGSGGSGGSLSFVCPPIVANQLAIVDFETGPAINSQQISTTVYFPSSPGVEVSFNAIVSGTGSLTRVTEAHGGAAALNFGVTGTGTRQGTLYMRFNPASGTPAGAKAACVDASHFTGMRFWAKGPASVELTAYTPQPTSEVGTVAHAASTSFGINNQWQLIEIHWDELQQSMIQFPFEPSGLWFFVFGLNGLQDQTLSLDDITFIP